MALILAIASWIVCPIVSAIVALVLAEQSNRAIDSSGGMLEGRAMNTATKWIAWINIVVSALGILLAVVVLVWAVSTNAEVVIDGTMLS